MKSALLAFSILLLAENTEADFAQQGHKLVGAGAIGYAPQGASVSLSSDGNTAIVGAPRDSDGTGAAWVWIRTDGVWSQQGEKLVGTGGVGASAQGCSVSLSSDGNTVIVGGVGDDDYKGAAWIFAQSASPILPVRTAVPRLLRRKNDLLRFEVPQSGKVAMRILDANGKIAGTLLEEFRDAGIYAIPLPTERRGVFGILDYSAGNRRETLAIHP